MFQQPTPVLEAGRALKALAGVDRLLMGPGAPPRLLVRYEMEKHQLWQRVVAFRLRS
jgi:hypothetical protein